MVEDRVGDDDEHRGEGHQGGGDARVGVLHGHQRHRDTEEGTEEGGERCVGHAFAVAQRCAHVA